MPIYQGKPSFAESLSSSIGTGLGNLAQLKMQEIERQHKLSDTLAVNKQKMQMAQQLQQSKLAQQLAVKERDIQANTQALIDSGIPADKARMIAMSSGNIQKDLIARPQREEFARYYAESRGIPYGDQAANENRSPEEQAGTNLVENISEDQGDEVITPQEKRQARQPQQAPFPKALNEAQLRILQGEDKIKAQQDANRIREERNQLTRQNFLDKLEMQRDFKAYDQFQKVSEDTTTRLRGADEIINGMDTIQEALKSPEGVRSGAVYNLLKRFNLEWLGANVPTQVVAKEAANAAADVAFSLKNPTEGKVNLVERGILSLSNTPEALQILSQIRKNKSLIDKAFLEERDKILNEAADKGKMPPFNYDALARKRSEDRSAELFKQNREFAKYFMNKGKEVSKFKPGSQYSQNKISLLPEKARFTIKGTKYIIENGKQVIYDEAKHGKK